MRILATGVSGGIGRAFERIVRQHPDWQLVKLMRTPEADAVAFDVTWPESAMAGALAGVGALDALVMLHGADILSPPLRHASYLERLDALYRVDVAGTIKTVRAGLGHLKENGTVVLMGWDRAGLGAAGEPGELYAAAKAAVTAFGKSLALAHAGRLSVYVVAPGWVMTRWGASLSPERQRRIAARTRSGQWQTPAQVASVLESCLTLPPAVLSGQVLYVNQADVLPG